MKKSFYNYITERGKILMVVVIRKSFACSDMTMWVKAKGIQQIHAMSPIMEYCG